MKKFLNIIFVVMISFFISGCDTTSTDTSNTDGGSGAMSGGDDIMAGAGEMAGGDMAGGDPMALANAGGGGDPIAMITGDSGGGSQGGESRFKEMGKFRATIANTYYDYISAADRDKRIKMSGYMMGSDGQYLIQIVGYDIKEDRLNPDRGFLMIQFQMPALDSGTGTYDLLYPASKDGKVEVTFTNSFNNGYDIKGRMPFATTYGENNTTIEMKNVYFDVHLIKMQSRQQ